MRKSKRLLIEINKPEKLTFMRLFGLVFGYGCRNLNVKTKKRSALVNNKFIKTV